jgi:hypothetical protein
MNCEMIDAARRRLSQRVWQALVGRAMMAIWVVLPTLPLLAMVWSWMAGIR